MVWQILLISFGFTEGAVILKFEHLTLQDGLSNTKQKIKLVFCL